MNIIKSQNPLYQNAKFLKYYYVILGLLVYDCYNEGEIVEALNTIDIETKTDEQKLYVRSALHKLTVDGAINFHESGQYMYVGV